MPRIVTAALLVATCLLGAAGVACGGTAQDATQDQDASASVCDARSHGAKGDGKTKDTMALQRAIDACAVRGGTVTLRSGTFLSGTIWLKSKVTLSIAPGATLLGSQDDADYPDLTPPTDNTQLANCKKALIYAESASDIRINGGGTIDGN